MPSSSLHINLYQWLKPFLELAKNKGILVTPDTHLQIVAVLSRCADEIEDSSVLFDYLSPLLAKNKEDYLLLKNEWERWCETEKLVTDNKAVSPAPGRRYRWLLVLLACLIVIAVAAFFYTYYVREGITANYVISYTDVMKPVTFDATSSLSEQSDTTDLKFAWNFGDGRSDTSSDPVVHHTYQTTGHYNSSLSLLPRSSHIVLLQRTMKTRFELCKPKPVIAQEPEAITVHQPVVFSALYDSSYPSPGGNEWQINGKTVARNVAQWKTQFDSVGSQTITYIDAGYVAGSGCDSTVEKTISIQPAAGMSFSVNQTGKTAEPPLKVNNKTLNLIVILFVWLGFIYFSNRKKLNERSDTASRSSDVMERLKGAKPPYQIPFTNNDELIDDEPLLPQVAKQLKRRVADENFYLDIPQTIATTIRSEGFLLPVFTQKTKPAEYLVLIDKKEVNSARVKLFEYLVKRFAKSDIYLETFYFYEKPDYGFNAYYPKGIYVTRLYDLYPDHTVLIFGNGYSFLDAYYPALDEAASLPYARWTQRVIFTPTPYADWANKEKLLQQRFTVLPADMEGQLLLFENMDKPEAAAGAGLQWLPSNYKAKGFNANKVKKIKEYLNDEFLFQWLCAISISPSIYWQTMLGIGDALQKERYYDRTITYSCLLKLVRLPWMRDTAFPEETRLDLLKALEPQNEVIARQALIKIMDEARLKVDDSSFAFEELYLQQMTDKFMLYSVDANDKRFADYKQAHDEFKLLWKEEQIKDTVLKEYLKKEDGGEWSTLIGNENLSHNPQASQSIDRLFDDSQLASKRKWLKIENFAIIVLAVLLLLFTGCLYFFTKNINTLSLNNKLQMVSTDSSRTVPFTFRVVANQCLNLSQRQKDSMVVTLDFGNNNLLSVGPNDTAKGKEIPYSWLGAQGAALHITSRDAAYNFDSSLVITSNQLSLSLNGCAVYCNNWKEGQTNLLEATYSGDWYENDITTGNKSSYSSVHIEPNSINDEKIEKVETCADNASLLRIITQNNSKAFTLYYLLQTDANIISFAQQGTSYQTAASAESDTTAFDMTTRIRLIQNEESFSKSNDFFSLFRGKWLLDNDSDVIEITPAGNKIIINDTSFFTATAEERAKTTWGKTIYKLPGIEKSSTQSGSFNLYMLPLDSTHLLVGADDNSTGGIHYTASNAGVLEKIHKNGATAETGATLPQSLYEIWHGGTSNRLISLFLPKNVIYYSVNDTKTYGTYNINEVSLLNDSIYKIVTKTNQGYKLFFIKNITSTSFDLSVCQNFLSTKEEAKSKTAADCDHFNTMSLYYENNPSLIYLPVSFSNNLVASQKAKLNLIVTAVSRKTATINGINVNLSYTPPSLSNTVAAINSFLGKNGISYKISNSDISSAVTNQPFIRSSIEIKTTEDKNISEPEQPSSNSPVQQQSSAETTLGTLVFDEKSGMPDNKSLQLIQAIAKQLNSTDSSRIKIYGYYYTKNEDYPKMQQYVTTTLNLFKKQDVAINRSSQPLQIETAFQVLLSPGATVLTQLSNTLNTKVKASHYTSVVITSKNFPAGFGVNENRRAN